MTPTATAFCRNLHRILSQDTNACKGPMFAIIIWWIVSAKKWFKGPKVNIAHMMLGQVDDNHVVEGVDVKGDNSADSDTSSGHDKAVEATKM